MTLASPVLLQPLSAATSETGTYRFPSIPVGIYILQFELSGFRTVVQEGVRVEIGFNAQINATLPLAGVEETLRVTAASPLVDLKDAGKNNRFTREALHAIPSARDPWALSRSRPVSPRTARTWAAARPGSSPRSRREARSAIPSGSWNPLRFALEDLWTCLNSDRTILENYNLKLALAPFTNNQFSFFFNATDKVRNSREASDLRPLEITFRQMGVTRTDLGSSWWTTGSPKTYRWSDRHVFNDRLTSGQLPAAAVGRYTFDGAGSFSGTQDSSVGGNVSQDIKQGTYTLNEDCTGTLTLEVYNQAGVLQRTSTWAIVVVDNGNGMRGILTSLKVGGTTSIPATMTLTATKLFPARAFE